MEIGFHNCILCNYKTKRKYDLKRHENAKHNKIKTQNNYTTVNNNYTTIDNNYTTIDNNYTTVNNRNLNIGNKCIKCNKNLSSKQYLQKHLLICKGVSNPFECHLCHKIYACYASKSKNM